MKKKRHTNVLLKPVTIDNAQPRDKAYALPGGGLLLEVFPSGTKTWRLKYDLNGKREKVKIGAYPALTIMQARGFAGAFGRRPQQRDRALRAWRPAHAQRTH